MMKANFEQSAWEAFQEAAAEKYDFTTCQRSDGSLYGTGGTCRKGTETSKSSDDKKSSSSSKGSGGTSSGEYRTRPKGAIEADMKKLTSSGAMNQKGTAGVKAREEHAKLKAELNKPLKGANSKSGDGVAQAPAPPKTTKKDPVKSVLNEQKKTKEFLKEDNKRIAKENPGLAQKSLQAKNKKLGEEYERLRGDKSPEATARRKKIMEDVNKNMTKIKDLDKKEAAKNTTRDSSPAGAQRRANAASRARD